MRRPNLFPVAIIVLFISLGLGFTESRAGNPLPPLPSQTVVNQVIAQTNGSTYTPLGIPLFVANAMGAFTQGDFAGVAARLDAQNTVTYIDLNHTIRHVVIPLIGSQNTTLIPDIQTPDDGVPAKILGGVFDQYQRTMLAVVTWKAPYHSGSKPEKLRFYLSGAGQLFYIMPYHMQLRMYKAGKGGQLPPSDVGALITTDGGCFVIGFDQVCYNAHGTLSDPAVKTNAQAAETALSHAYSYHADFDQDNALPDLVGATQRTACANAFTTALSWVIPSCTANLVFTNVKDYHSNQPIMLMRALAANDLRAYDPNGNFLGTLPAGDYLVIDVTPNTAQFSPGAPGALFLVSSDQQHQYIIPSRVMQDLGASGDPLKDTDLGQAAIKDGMAAWRGF